MSELSEVCQGYQALTQSLLDALNQLEEQITPVLSPPVDQKAVTTNPPPARCQLATYLREQNIKLDSLISRVHTLRERLCL